MEKQAKERDPELRAAWIMKLGEWEAHQLVFLDESGVNLRTGERKYGWAKKGNRAVVNTATGMRENFSLLPAMNIDGYLACCVYKGAVNGATFEAFVEHELLPLCNPYPLPNSIIVMDNASIHKHEVF